MLSSLHSGLVFVPLIEAESDETRFLGYLLIHRDLGEVEMLTGYGMGASFSGWRNCLVLGKALFVERNS